MTKNEIEVVLRRAKGDCTRKFVRRKRTKGREAIRVQS